MDWPPELNKLFALYSEIYNLKNQWSDPKARYYYAQFVPPEQIEFYLATEQVAHTMEIGCFMKFYNRLITRLLKDIQENSEGMDDVPAEEEFKKMLFPEAVEDIDFISKNPVFLASPEDLAKKIKAQQISPEEFAAEIEAQQNAFGLKLLVAFSSVPQLMGAGLSLFLNTGEKILAIASLPSEASQENEASSSTSIYLAAGCTLALVSLGCYYFWHTGNAKKQPVENVATNRRQLQ